MVTRAQVVTEARGWLGTRYQHQMSEKGVASDCIGLVRGVVANTGLLPRSDVDAKFAPFQGYGRHPSGELVKAMGMYMTPITKQEAKQGDLVLMVFGEEPTHVALLAPYPHGGFSIIHSYLSARKVVETRLDPQLEARIVGYFRLPNIEE